MRPIRFLLTYPIDANVVQIIEQITNLGKSHQPPHIQIADPDTADEYQQHVMNRLQQNRILLNRELNPEDRARYIEDYASDPTDPAFPPTKLEPAPAVEAAEAARAEEVSENLIDSTATTRDEIEPPATPTPGREDRAAKATGSDAAATDPAASPQ